VADALDLLDDVVVQLQLLQPREGVQVLDLEDVCVGEAVLRKESERTLILPKFICGSLGMILFSVR
jgi:hypothetical protein